MKLFLAFAAIASAAAQTTPNEWNQLTVQLYSQARYQDAEAAACRALAVAQPDQAADAGHAHQNLAAIYRALGDLKNAELSALAAAQFLPPSERTGNHILLAAIYGDQRRLPEAEAILRTELNAPPGRITVTVYNNLASLAIYRGDLADAAEYARQAVAAAQSFLPPNHPATAAALNNLGQAYRFQGEYLLAETNLRQAIDIWRAAKGPDHPDVATGLMNLGGLYHSRGREALAEELYRRAAGLLDRAFGSQHPSALVARNELGEVLRAQRRFTESARLSQATLPVLENAFGPADERVLRARANAARLAADVVPTASLKVKTLQ